MQDIDVLFLVEHVDRQLDIVTCLMQKLESGFGITSEARNYYYDFQHSLAQFNPSVVVFPFFMVPITSIQFNIPPGGHMLTSSRLSRGQTF
jgi:hypothetical protein